MSSRAAPRFRRCARRLTILLTLLLAGGSPGAFALAIGTFASLDITEVTGSHTGTLAGESLYSFDFRFSGIGGTESTGQVITGPSSFGYLNVVDSSNKWLVQDQAIPLAPDFFVTDPITIDNSVWFYGDSATIFGAQAILNDSPFGAAPTPDASWSGFGPTNASVDWGSDDPQGQSNPPVIAGDAPAGPKPAVIEGYLRGGVPDKSQHENECGPTSAANSLLWLIGEHSLDTSKLPKTPADEVDMDDLLRQLAKKMSPDWVETPLMNNSRGYDGLNGDELKDGKEAFIKEKGLPIVVKGGKDDPKATGKNTFEFVKSELKAGEDVEFLIDWPGAGSHWVTVVGYIDNPNGENSLIVHDPDDKKTGNVYWKLDDMGNFSSPRGTALWAVSESVVAAPGTLLLVLLCVPVLVMTARHTRAQGGWRRRSRSTPPGSRGRMGAVS